MSSSQRGQKRSADTHHAETIEKRSRLNGCTRSDFESDPYLYMSGFGNEFATEALEGALPKGQNNPQKCPYGLYAEQLSGTAFTVPRAQNRRSWLYRIRPSVQHDALKCKDYPNLRCDFTKAHADPNQMRWQPQPIPEEKTTFLQGLRTKGGAGDPAARTGIAVHLYACNTSMGNEAFYNSDGDFLIVPQQGTLTITTEFGRLSVAPHEIVVIQSGMKFSVDVDGPSRGYILEVYGVHFKLPDLGPIGANGLANPRDFLTPVAHYEEKDEEFKMVNKYMGEIFETRQQHTPFDVVAWHGNYVPYKYNLDNFCCMNSVTFDHPDPSIYTVLTAPSPTPGVAVADFVIFPPRWMVMNNTFRPPYYHRNCMTEYMGMVYGKYDAKVGFVPGGASLHSCMTPHGPDTETFYAASTANLEPQWFGSGLAFMFETSFMLRLTDYALNCEQREMEYQKCWQQLPKLFDPTKKDVEIKKPN